MTLDQIKPLGNRVLVLLPVSADEQKTASGLFVAHALTPPASYGRVLKVGPAVRDVQPGDLVAFPTTAGDPIPLSDQFDGLFLREPEIAAIVPKREAGGAV